MNFWCGAYNLVYLFVATSSGWELAAFCRRYPEARPPPGPPLHPPSMDSPVAVSDLRVCVRLCWHAQVQLHACGKRLRDAAHA
jgi:hypothetical protein